MIRFPRQHVADSVAQRIMAVEKRMNANNVAAQGRALEKALSQPAGEMAAPAGIEDAIVGRSLGV